MFRNFLVLITASLWVIACEEKDKSGKKLDTITTGEITIAVEDGYKPVIASCIDVFDSIYRTAKINARYVSESEAVQMLIDDTVQVVIIGRKLAEKELSYFKARGFEPPTTAIAHDALAFIVNRANTDTVLSVQQIRDILSGKLTQWKEINAKSSLGEITVVFDNAGSGTLRYVRDSIIAGQELNKQASALKTNEDVLAYVKQKKNAIGIIAANWISDTDDSGAQKFRRETPIVQVSKEPGAEGFPPYQWYLATGEYPFKRTVYIINAQARRNGLGMGLASYLAKDGQRIMLKDGLLPTSPVTRYVKTSK